MRCVIHRENDQLAHKYIKESCELDFSLSEKGTKIWGGK